MLRKLTKMLKSFFFFIISILKRIFCCFRRRKRTNDFVPLTQIGVVSNQVPVANAVESWGDWNEPANHVSKISSVQEHIEHYRQQAIAARQVKEVPEEQENFFENMTPKITKQTKVYISENTDENNSFNTYSLAPENLLTSQELEEWEDDTGWEDQSLDIDARAALKESRRQARLKKMYEQQQRRQEKVGRSALGAKVYS
ncbi:hypothetical protein FQA39_LY09772 [Lamprigera yunnana]|nr:hypothetical protein FQA39_LY09772 [Lamprigera yunnana]